MSADNPARSGETSPAGKVRRRWITVVVTVLGALAALLTVPPIAAPTYATAAEEDRPSEFVSYNMQGSNRGARWIEDVAPRAGASTLVALQEVGPGPPPRAARVDDAYRTLRLGPRPHGQPSTASVTRWRVGREIRHVYFLQTDPQRSTGTGQDAWSGGRVNLATVTAREADDVRVLENPSYHPHGPDNAYRSRPLLGLRFGDTWYWNTHARGRDVAGLLDQVRGFARDNPDQPNWVVVGDFNLDIRNRNDSEARRSLHLRSDERLLRSDQPTHISGDRHSELDYAITRGDLGDMRAAVPRGAGADHVPVHFGPTPPAPQPSVPAHASSVGVVTETGQAIQAGRNGTFEIGGDPSPLDMFTTMGGAHFFRGGGSGGARSVRGAEGRCPSLSGDARRDANSRIVAGPCDDLRAHWSLTDAIGDVGLNEDSEGAQRWRNVAVPELCLTRSGKRVAAAPCDDDPDQHWWTNAVDPPGDWPTAAGNIRMESASDSERLRRRGNAPGTGVYTAPKPPRSWWIYWMRQERLDFGWNLERISPGENLVRFKSLDGADQCLGTGDVHAGESAGAQLSACDADKGVDGAGQRWLSETFADGTIRYRNEADNLCLRHSGKDGSTVSLSTCDDTEAQRWRLRAPNSKPTPNPDTKKLRVRAMPLGDSITAGVESSDNNGYRDELYDALRGEVGEGRVDFVGSVRRGTMADRDNEGHPGERIDEIAGYAKCAVPRYQPNVITLHAGTNDFDQRHQLSTAPRRMKRLIEQVLEDSPKAVVVVAKVIPTAKPGMQPRIDAFNAKLPGIVSDLRADGKHVVLTDTSDIEVSDGLQNDSHPNDEGYAKLGRNFHEGVMEAADKGWIKTPAPQRPPTDCTPGPGDDASKAGPGWRALGAVAPGMTYPPGRTELADFDGDGRDDYVRVSGDGEVRIALNRKSRPGKPRWKEVESGIDLAGWGDRDVRFADIDGDGGDDIVMVPEQSEEAVSVRVFLNNGVASGEMSWSLPHPVKLRLTGVPQEAVRFADVNGDGRDDYLRVGEDGSVHAYYNLDGDEPGEYWKWKEHRYWAPGVFYGSRSKLRLADVNGDGKADYLMVGKRGAVHAYINNGGRGHGGFTEHRYFVRSTGYPGSKSAFRDISGDGKADYIVVYDGGSVRAWLNRGGNT